MLLKLDENYGNESLMRGDSSSHSTSILQIFDATSPVLIREFYCCGRAAEVVPQFCRSWNES
jgi:hypothetical protein